MYFLIQRGLSFLLVIFIGLTNVQAQRTIIKGSVIDAKTKEPLPFANVLFVNSTTGTTSDYDGRFVLETSKKYLQLEARYLGYQAKIIDVEYGKSQVVFHAMTPNKRTLKEVEEKSKKQK